MLVTGSGLSRGRIAYGALAMGAGICLMHYGGMWAMRMEPGIGYDPLWFAISVLIAVSASAAALFDQGVPESLAILVAGRASE